MVIGYDRANVPTPEAEAGSTGFKVTRLVQAEVPHKHKLMPFPNLD
jgi:hypothetical protein